MIDFVPRKKNEVIIKAEMSKENKAVKPKPGVDRKRMIDDLQDRFQFQGMKDAVVGIDPKLRKRQQLEELMRKAPVTKSKRTFKIPDYASKYYEEKYGKALDPKSLEKYEPSESGMTVADQQNAELEDIFDQVVDEIQERQNYLKEISEIGKSKDIEERVKAEIVARIAELQKIREMQRKG